MVLERVEEDLESPFEIADWLKIRFVDTLYLRMLAYPAACLPELEAGVFDNRSSESHCPAAATRCYHTVAIPVLMIQKIPNGFR